MEKFAGTNKTQLVENEDYGYCSIIKSCKKVLDKLELENRTFAKVGYPFHEEKTFVDKDALREAVINAFVHNDYSELMCPAFYIFSDHIEIVSYGGLIDGMSREELISGCSRPRNREIMRIFKDVDLVEQLGTGMEKMLAAYTPNIFELSPNFFHVMLRPEAEKTTEKILRAIKDNPYITTKELALEFDITDDGVFYHIRKLRIAGRIQRAGGRKSGYWEVLK